MFKRNSVSKNLFLFAVCINLLTLSLFQSMSNAKESNGQFLKEITLQLIWKHQAQFVGYYVAKEKGFYRDAGFHVDIREFRFDTDVTQDVLSGKADFGVGRSSLVLEKMEGRDMLLLSAIFQHSPLVLLSLKRDDLKTIADLKGKRIMVADNMVGMAALTSMLLTNRVIPDSYTKQEHTFNIDDLINGKTDAIAAYVSNEPFQMEKRGIDYTVFKPADHGIDFYSDILFTSKKLHNINPTMVHQFNEASLRGWQYAFDHMQEAVGIILKKYNTQNRDPDALQFEIETLKKLAYSGDTPLGNIDEDRVEDIARAYRLLGFTKNPLEKKGFLMQNDASATLTSEEDVWITQRKTPVIVGAETDWAPFDFVKNNNVTGYSNELLRLAAKKVRLPIEFVSGYTWSELLKQFEAGSVEILPAIYKTPEREKAYAFTNMYAVNPTVLVALRTNESINGIDDVSGKKIASVAGYSTTQLMKSRCPDIQAVEVKNVYAGLKSVSLGKADAFIGSLAVISHIMKTHVLPDIRIVDEVTLMNFDETTLHMAVLKKHKMLRDILQKGLDAVTEAEHNALRKKWLMPPATEEKVVKINFTQEEQAWIAANSEIKVSLTDWPPFEFINDAGEQEGISIEVTKLVASRVGLTPVFVSDKWSVLSEKLKSGELDLAPSVAKNKERETYWLFTEPYIFLQDAVFTRQYFEKEVKDLNDLEGMTIAVEKGYYQHSHLSEHYPKIKLHVVPSTLEALQAVNRGEADAYIGTLDVGSYMIGKYLLSDLKVAAYLDIGGNDIHMAVPLDKKILCDIMQKGLDSLTKKDIREIKSRYIMVEASRSEPEIILTPEEKGWLRKYQTMIMGIDSDFFPFDYVDENGAHGGVASDYIGYLARRLKVKFNFTRGLSWQEMLKKAKNGKIDVIPCLMATPERKKFLLFTKPYISSSIVIFTRKSSPFMHGLEDLLGKRVAVLKNYYIHESLVRDHPNLDLVTFDSGAEALQALSEGNVDAYVGEILSTGYAIEKLGINNLKVAAASEYNIELAMGVRKDWPNLVTILNKGLDSVTPQKAAEFRSHWIGLTFEHKTDIKTILTWALPIGGGLMLIIFVIVAANRRLGREITERKRAEAKIKESEERNRLILNTAGEGIFGVNTSGEVIFINKAALAMLGYTRKELLGQKIHTVIHHIRPDGTSYPVEECPMNHASVRNTTSRIEDEILWTKDGKTIEVEYVAVPMTQNGELIGAVISFQDISARKKAERERDDAFEVITGSINYASNIQEAILPSKGCLTDVMPEHFILWQPRDKVGGDIYFIKPWGPGIMIALIDCTGHGVPGAFMTLIANGALEMAILNTPPGETDTLLQCTHQLLQQTLNQDTDGGNSDDGLETGICYLAPQNKKMIYSGARFTLFQVSQTNVTEIKGDKKGIGYRATPQNVTFRRQEIALEKGRMTYYLTTDGLIDQVGGGKRRGFGKKRFKNLLLELEGIPMDQRSKIILKTLEEYQGQEKRRDDVAVIGFKP